jgi:molybdopterin synthase catalytic subunit
LDKFFVKGPIGINIATKLIRKIKADDQIGAHTIFLGQVRADEKKIYASNKRSKVEFIHYTAYKTMAAVEIKKIIEKSTKKFNLNNLIILHSLGKVNIGEISMLIIASTSHRKSCISSIKYVVDEFKKNVPIWKKERYENGSYRWVD